MSAVSGVAPDVYTESADDLFLGTRRRTRPGQEPGEEIHDKVRDASGREVSNKPANRALLAGQRARLERVALVNEQKRARDLKRKTMLLAFFLPLLSNFITGTYTFNLAPIVRPHLRHLWRHPLNPFAPEAKEFSLLQLSAYDGTNLKLPVYISIDGDVYDVTANRRIYGKGGSYNMMAGRDASRSFVTGCFKTHLTHDLRGLSEIELKSLDHWKSFFANHEKYFFVGKVILPPINPKSPIPPPCRDTDAEAPGSDAARHGGSKPDPVAQTAASG